MTLLERARKLAGPDREVDYEIETLMLPFLTEYNYVRCDGDNGWYSSTPAVSGAEQVGPAADYTASLDAVVGLIEAKLPGRSGVVTFGPHLWHRAEFVGARGVEMHEVCRTPALALCALLLAAINPQETTS